MHRLFVSENCIDGNIITVCGEDVEHLHAVRIREGETISVSDGISKIYTAKAEQIRKDSVILKIISESGFEHEPSVFMTVCIAVLKGDGCEDVIRRSIELGASRIVLFASENCVADKRGKTDRFIKIAHQAAMQSGRDIIPTVDGILTYNEMINVISEADIGMFFHETAITPLTDYIKDKKIPRTVAFCVGPEGGFSDKEVEIARTNNIPIISLGKRIMRAVTAPLYASSVIMSLFDGEH